MSYCLSCGDLLPPYAGVGPKRKYCEKASCNATLRYRKTTVITKITHSWSKYDDTPREKSNSDWNCQACGKEYPKELPPYLFAFDFPRDMLRICGICQKLVIDKGISNFNYLKMIVRPHPFG